MGVYADYIRSMREDQSGCFGRPDQWDPNTADCAYRCNNRKECAAIVASKRGGTEAVAPERRVWAPRPNGSQPTGSRSMGQSIVRCDVEPVRFYAEETPGQRLTREIAASVISAAGGEVWRFFSPGNYRFPPNGAMMVSCSKCSKACGTGDRFCANCGNEL